MNTSTTDYAPNSIDFEQRAVSVTKPNDKPSAKPPGQSLDAWSQLVMTGTAAMASDEDLRRSIASKLS